MKLLKVARRLTMRAGMAGAFIIAMLALAGVISPVHAESTARPLSSAEAKAITDCPSGRMCVWSGENFTGLLATFPETGPGGCVFPALFAYHSAYNRTGSTQRLWQYIPCRGASRSIANGAAIPAIGPYSAIGGP